MRQLHMWITVAALCCAASATAGEKSPDARLQEAQTAFDDAIKLYKAGKYAEAMAQGEHALVLREALLGGSHLAVANCLDLLGTLHQRQGNSARGEQLLMRALGIRGKALGQHHPDVAGSLNNLASFYSREGSYSQAQRLYRRALAIQEAALGKHHPDVAISLYNLALLYSRQGLYSQAEPLYLRALAIQEAALGKHHPNVAGSLSNLAILYYKQGLYGQAEPLYQRVLAIQEAALGQHHPTVAETLNNLANLYSEQGLYDRAEPLYQRALVINEAALGKDHPDVAGSLNNLADLYLEQGLYSQAEPLFERALAIREAALGKHHPDVARSLTGLASVYLSQGLSGQAKPLFERALAIQETALGKHHLHVASSLNDLARLYSLQGLYGQAESLYQRALAISEAAFGKHRLIISGSLTGLANVYLSQGLSGQAKPLFERALAIQETVLGKHHPHVASSLTDLASLYFLGGLYDQAEPLFERALAIQEKALGKHHPAVARSLGSLANLYSDQGLYGKAKMYYERALAIFEGALGKHHPGVANLLTNLAILYSKQGMYDRAKPLHERAIAILEAAFGENHPALAWELNRLAFLRLAQRRLDAAVPLFTRTFSLSEQRLRQEALGFSEARMASFLQVLRSLEERLYSLLRAYPRDASVRRLALASALLLKGRSVEETASISRAVYQSLGAEERGTFEQLRGLRTRLASLSLQGPGALSPATYQQQLKELAAQGAALEASLARRSAPLRALAALPSPADIVDRVAAALPKDGALVEFIAYLDHPLVRNPGRPAPQLRYLALVLRPNASIRVLDLGPAEPINSAASRLRDALANRDAAFQVHAQALYRLAFKPLLPLLGKTRRLFLSPDGQLALVPFSALHNGRQFLVDTFDFTYLTSGKDLLPRTEEIAPATSVAVLADPDFSAPPQAPAPSSSIAPFSPTLSADSTRRAWTTVPLPGTRKEAEAIHRLLPQAQLFLGAEATKERLLQLPPPGILHLATHGFFLEDAPTPTRSRAVGHFGAMGENTPAPRLPDPLLRSGLLFAGASAPAPDASRSSQPPPDNALATALELAGLNLWGTQLVVLSACDTGRGDVKLGQGVYGLRRAFIIAGAETVVMSLWKVNDATTSTLMEAYYRNLLAGQGRAKALREAMRSLRATNPHPHYWAPFIALGRDTPLRENAPVAQGTPEQ